MKAVIQRVNYATVKVDDKIVGEISKGLLIYLGVMRSDRKTDADVLAKKISNLRIFKNENGKMNRSCLDNDYEALVISQFTLCADLRKGNRPSFSPAAEPDYATELYEYFIEKLKQEGVNKVQTGSFGADMKVTYENDGPVTILYDSMIYNKKLKVEKVLLSPYDTNCYIICDDESKTGAVIDPGDFNKILTDKIQEMGIKKLEYIILTHGHFDHVTGVSKLKKLFPEAAVCINKNDEQFLIEESGVKADKYLEENDILKIGTAKLRVMETPGHTRGCVILFNEDYMFTGDTLFCKEIGRCDLPTGDYNMMLDSLRKIKNLKNNYIVYPGHGISSSLDSEKQTNKYLVNLGE